MAREATVWIIEDSATGAWLSYSGRVSAELQDPDNDRYVEGPQGVDIDEAIAWGRKTSGRVMIRLDDDFYTAGEVVVSGVIPWSESVLRPRARQSYESRERYDGPWLVRITFAGSPEIETISAAFDEAGFGAQTVESDGRIVVECVVRPTASKGALELASEAANTIPTRTPTLGRDGFGKTFEVRVIGPANG